ncbi:tetratricopeptide repeat protein [Leptothoe spongobia]|uniref:Tetratricopeptide repeat protein n=1 Tax=Leptothoe spongobia TAU-MAC 1115 TaxID=1967444 RepID=A0A947DI74_9CYAN|nr:tetratricopeptide repeat protein [Leptothoe spongobia]MBT9317417.1 tetratricopeptide repeat protein [Leptothoe spongobia TAU-MAC 1115]
MRHGLIALSLASVLGVGLEMAVRPSWAYGNSLELPKHAIPRPKQNDTNAEIAGLRSQAEAQNTANLNYRQQINTLIEAQTFNQVENLVTQAITSGTQAIKLLKQALALSQSTADNQLTDQLYAELAKAYSNLSSTYNLQATSYGKQDQLAEQLLAQQNNLQVQTEQLEIILPSQNQELIVTTRVGLTIIHWSISQTHNQLGQHLEGIESATITLELAQHLAASKLELFTLLSLSQHHWALGEAARKDSEYLPSLEYLTLARTYAEQVLAISDRPLGQFPSSDFLPDSVLIKTSEDKTYFTELTLTSLWSVQISLGDLHADQQSYATATEFYEQALDTVQRLGNKNQEFNTLNLISVQYQRLARYDRALDIAIQTEQLAQAIDSPPLLLRSTLWLARLYDDLGNYPEALKRYEATQDLAKRQKNISTQLTVLNNMGLISSIQGDYTTALDAYNQALALNQTIRTQLTASNALQTLGESCFLWTYQDLDFNDRQVQQLAEQARQLCLASTWELEQTLYNNIGGVYAEQGRYQDSLDLRNRSLEIVKDLNNPAAEAQLINNIGNIHQEQGNYTQALASFQAALAIEAGIDARSGMATSLNNIAIVYDSQGEYTLALDYYQRALQLVTDIGLKPLEPTTLGNIGTLYQAQGDYVQADQYLQQALQLSQDLMFLPTQATQLLNLSNLVGDQGDYAAALDYANQALEIHQRIGQRSREANSIRIRGDVYLSQGDFSNALTDQQTALRISRELDDLDDVAYSLQALGQTYETLGQPDQAIPRYQEALNIFKEIGAVTGQASIYNTLGNSAANQGNYADALTNYQQALAIYQTVGAVGAEALTLTNIGYAQYNLNNLDVAQNSFTQALTIQRRIGRASDMGSSLKGLGLVAAANQPTEALELLQQALAMYREQGNRPSEASTLATIGNLLSDQGQPELASVFLKQSVNTYETIRETIRTLDQTLQTSYTESIADTYRQLADVLLTQGRIPEAQRVLDLLKIEELREFTSQTRSVWSSNGISLTPLEQSVHETHGSLIALSQAIEACDATRCATRGDLSLQRENLIAQYKQQVQKIEAAYRRDCEQVDDQCVNPEDLGNEASKLLAANEDAVLVYPLVVDNKLWILWAAQNNVVGSIEVQDVSREQLALAVADFRQEIGRGSYSYGDRASLEQIQAKSQKLYDWLIRPLEAELTKNQIKHLIFAHDRYTRYIPMAALHDGEQYLIEKYAVSSILAATATDLDSPPAVTEASVLGLGLSDPAPPFLALENVPVELDSIVKETSSDSRGFYDGKVFLNKAFNRDLMRSEVYQHQILHIATHGKFEPGSPDQSFILLGNGEPLPIPEIDTLLQADLENVHLVVLSACETAYGEEGSDGREIAGISSYFLKGNRAQAVMASLWAVNDESTSLLMQRFYEFLASGELTKAEALQQAQLSLLYSQDVETRLTAMRSSNSFDTAWEGQSPGANSSIAHPYHWAPFILIGNAL